MSSAPALTVIIPTRDRWSILERTLKALQEQTVRDFEVLVVVDGVDQPMPRVPGAELLQVEHGGPGAARNAGARAVRTPLVLFLGDDMLPRPDLVERHVARHHREQAPEVAVLGHVDWHPEVRRTPLLAWIDRTGMQFDYASIQGDVAGYGRFYSCNVSLKRDFFLAAGGFDPDFVYYYEDLDAGVRLDERGMRLLYERAAVADHLHHYAEDRYAVRLAGVAAGERLMAAKHPQFRPFFAERFRSVEGVPQPSRRWRHAATLALPGALQDKASAAWTARFAPDFLDAFEAPEELAELRSYLGPDYDEALLRGHQRAVDAEEHAAPDELTFYRTSRAYLYDLTVFAMSGTKRPYRHMIRRMAPPGARLLDYGCGIGSDGLRLLDLGYDVSFADFANPSVDYLRWRLARRGLEAPVHDVDREVPGGQDLVYCFDVLEHVADPFAFLERLESLADIVVVNLLEPTDDDVHVHKPLPLRALLDHVVARGLVSYRLHHGRSHLVAYRGRPASGGDRVAGRLRIARDRLRQPRARP